MIKLANAVGLALLRLVIYFKAMIDCNE